MRNRLILFVMSFMAVGAWAGPTFSVSFEEAVRGQPATGRLVVYLVSSASRVAGREPASGPFWDDPQPLYGIDVKGLAPGTAALVDDGATSFPAPLSHLPPGEYTAQAVLDMHRDNSEWRREPGNLFSAPVKFSVVEGESPRIGVVLDQVVKPRERPRMAGAELFEIRSQLLSEFHGRDIMLRAGVVFPRGGVKPGVRYPVVYEVPGFGGDSGGAWSRARGRASGRSSDVQTRLDRNCCWIILDPESGNGHTLFANSANNGPWGDALTRELIPALEAKYPLDPSPQARLLRGHSSGGWSTLWLALKYPDVFGAVWATSPDPVDFQRFQLPDIYARRNMYRVLREEYPGPPLTDDLPDTPSYRRRDGVAMTIRQENLMEEVIGPDNTSGQQWDSWQAVFGPRNARGNPAALYDPKSGAINRAVAEQYRKHDIGEMVRREPGVYGIILHQRCRILVGDQDSFYLEEAVALLKAESDQLSFFDYPEGRHGYIKILPGFDHGSIADSSEMKAIPREMLDHLARHELLREPEPSGEKENP